MCPVIIGDMIPHPILSEIDAFLRIHKLSESAFGRLSVNDWKLIRQIKAGRRLWPDTEARIRTFMVTYQPRPRRRKGGQ